MDADGNSPILLATNNDHAGRNIKIVLVQVGVGFENEYLLVLVGNWQWLSRLAGVVKLLLERYAHLLSVAGQHGLTIAHMAAERGSLEVVRQVVAIDRRVACFSKNAVRLSAVLAALRSSEDDVRIQQILTLNISGSIILRTIY